VLIIDEIDYLKTREEEVLYNIFEWTQKKRSNLIIIAISNTMDFPETLTQKLNSRIGNKRLPFKPYGSTQLEEILKQRVGPMNIFEEQAIIYICKKLVQCSSDVRKCLYILRESISEFLTRVRKDEKKK
jgi:origin recognition complex subunit 1